MPELIWDGKYDATVTELKQDQADLHRGGLATPQEAATVTGRRGQ